MHAEPFDQTDEIHLFVECEITNLNYLPLLVKLGLFPAARTQIKDVREDEVSWHSEDNISSVRFVQAVVVELSVCHVCEEFLPEFLR